MTISQDPEYTFDKDIEDVLWQLHNVVNMAYRNLIYSKLRGQEHVVTRRKVEKLYKDYLTTASAFYTGYFQRLQGLHGMPQIPRINRVLQLESPKAETKEQSAQIRTAVQHSFYTTLVHLGDISRWRHKIRPRPQSLKMAALYYELAIDLNPRSGGAHHQLGVLDQDNHLHVVYRFYRSIAVEKPHPHAKVNLEAEFKKLSQGNNTPVKRHNPPDPTEAFSGWFAKLHARLYKGERFSQELEEEVLHGLVKTLKKPDALPLLLKMVITNIAAYYVAKQKVDMEWSREASDSCQFILGLNIKWILVLSRTLQSELHEYNKAAPPDESDSVTDDKCRGSGSEPFSIFAENVLPLARVYLAWLVVYRTDIVQFQDHLVPHVFDMHRDLARSLTAIARRFNQQLVASPCLLAEDVESVGLKPFDDSSLHEVCRIHHEPGKATFKPHWEDSTCPKMTLEEQTMSRIHDLLRCGFVLALDETYPLTLDSSGDSIQILYVEGTKIPFPAQNPHLGNVDIPVTSACAVDSVGKADAHEGHTLPRVSALGNGESAAVVGSGQQASARSPAALAALHNQNSEDTPKAGGLSDDEVDVTFESRMHDMVDHLMDDDSSIGDLGQAADGTQNFLREMPRTDGSRHFDGAGTKDQGSGMLFDVTSPHNLWGSFQGLGLSAGKTSNVPLTSWKPTSGGNPSVDATHLSACQQPVAPFITSAVRPASGSGSEGPSPFSPGNTGAFGAYIGHDVFGRPTPSPGIPGVSGEHHRQNVGVPNGSVGLSPYLSAASGYAISEEKAKSVSPPLNIGYGRTSFSTGLPLTASVNGAFFGGGPPVQRDLTPNYQTYSGSNSTTAHQYLQPGHMNMLNSGSLNNDRNAIKGTSVEAAVSGAEGYGSVIFQGTPSGTRLSRHEK